MSAFLESGLTPLLSYHFMINPNHFGYRSEIGEWNLDHGHSLVSLDYSEPEAVPPLKTDSKVEELMDTNDASVPASKYDLQDDIKMEDESTNERGDLYWVQLDLPPIRSSTRNGLSHLIGTAIVDSIFPNNEVPKATVRVLNAIVEPDRGMTLPSTSVGIIQSDPNQPVPESTKPSVQSVGAQWSLDDLDLPELKFASIPEEFLIPVPVKREKMRFESEVNEMIQWLESGIVPAPALNYTNALIDPSQKPAPADQYFMEDYIADLEELFKRD